MTWLQNNKAAIYTYIIYSVPFTILAISKMRMSPPAGDSGML